MNLTFSSPIVLFLITLTIINVLTLTGRSFWEYRQAKNRKSQMDASLQASEQRIAKLLKDLDDNRAAFAESAKKIRSLGKE